MSFLVSFFGFLGLVKREGTYENSFTVVPDVGTKEKLQRCGKVKGRPGWAALVVTLTQRASNKRAR